MCCLNGLCRLRYMALNYTHFIDVTLCCDAARRCSRRSTKKRKSSRRDAEGRRRIFRFNRRNALPKAPRLLFHLPDFSLLLFFSAPLRLCARYLSPVATRQEDARAEAPRREKARAETQREEGEFSDLTGAMPSPRLRGFYFICLISLFFSFSLRLCVSARAIFLQAVHASFFQGVDAADDAVFHQRGAEVEQ